MKLIAIDEIKTDAQERQVKLEARILAAGGTVPEPWPWAVLGERTRKGRKVTIVDTALRNLQLLETLEDLGAAR